MININLRNKTVQQRISQIKDTLKPFYDHIASQVTGESRKPKGLSNFKFSYDLQTSFSRKNSEAVYFAVNYGDNNKPDYYGANMVINFDNENPVLTIIDSKHDIFFSKVFKDYDTNIDEFTTVNEKEYANTCAKNWDRHQNLLSLVKELSDESSRWAVIDYVSEVFVRWNYELGIDVNRKQGKLAIYNKIAPEIEVLYSYADSGVWYRLPDEALDHVNADCTIIDYRAPFVIRPDDDVKQLNKLAQCFTSDAIIDTESFISYVQQYCDNFDSPIYEYTDDNLNKALANMTPAEIVKTTHITSINFNDESEPNEAEYFTVNDGRIELLDSVRADSMIREKMPKMFNAYCKKHGVELKCNRKAKEYWI